MNIVTSSLICIFLLLCPASFALAKSQHSFSIGTSNIHFSQGDGQLQGQMTPPGILATGKDTKTVSISYDYFLDDTWSIHFAFGIPPKVELYAAVDGAALGKVGDARSISPGVLALYHLDLNDTFSIYTGAGVNYSTFSDATVTESYTQSFFGTSSDVELEDHIGGIFKFGAQINFGQRWFIDLSYAKYQSQLKSTITTETPMVGDVVRSIKTDMDPEVTTLLFGYRF